MVASNASTECWVVNVPTLERARAAAAAATSADATTTTAAGAIACGFVIEEPDDEKYFAMVDRGKLTIVAFLIQDLNSL